MKSGINKFGLLGEYFWTVTVIERQCFDMKLIKQMCPAKAKWSTTLMTGGQVGVSRNI